MAGTDLFMSLQLIVLLVMATLEVRSKKSNTDSPTHSIMLSSQDTKEQTSAKRRRGEKWVCRVVRVEPISYCPCFLSELSV